MGRGRDALRLPRPGRIGAGMKCLIDGQECAGEECEEWESLECQLRRIVAGEARWCKRCGVGELKKGEGPMCASCERFVGGQA